jgi:surface antigen
MQGGNHSTAAIAAVILIPLLLIGSFAGGSSMNIPSVVQQSDAGQRVNDCDNNRVQQAKQLETDTNPQLSAALLNNPNASLMAQFLLLGKGGDLKGLKFSRVMVAGILGNYYQESGVRFAVAEHHNGNSDGHMDHMDNATARAWAGSGKANGLGIAQWTWCSPDRACTLVDLANGMGKNWYDGDVQVQMMVNELTHSYRSTVYDPLTRAGSPQDAAKIWMDKYEGIPGSGSLTARQQAALQFYNIFNQQNLGSATVALAPTSGSGDTPPSTEANGTKPSPEQTDSECNADNKDDQKPADAASYGQIGGAPNTKGDYSWMCASMKVCKAGDAGTFAPKPFGYQCVWYAWTRLKMVHPENWSLFTISTGRGGDAWMDAQRDSANWIVSDTPKPGWAASGNSHPFAGSTHIAVVEEVQPDPSGWKVHLSEGNFATAGNGGIGCEAGKDGCWNGYQGTRWLTKAQMSGVHFFANKAWKN